MKTDELAQDRRLGRCILAGFLWLGVHLFVAVQNFRDSLYVTFDGRTYVWAAMYTAALFLLDVLLFFLNSPGAARKWLRYWGFCTAVCGIVFRCQMCQLPLGLWAVFPLAATPILHYDPLWRMIFQMESVRGLGCTALVCGGHVIYFLRLMRRGSREETDGTVGL